jgi:hypothetical protein
MRVTFKRWSPELASTRYRSIMPERWLRDQGVSVGTDWLVIGKHGWSWPQETEGFARVCFDVCDDHFDSEKWGSHYHVGCREAAIVTCNSPEMARVIKAQTGKEAVVIPDPYEQPEMDPRISDRLLWFGHGSNLPDLLPWLPKIGEVEIVSNIANHRVTPWTHANMDAAFSRSGLVVIPTGKSMAKSGNRAIESLRRGLFPVCGFLPAYADLGVWIGDIADGVDWALNHRGEAMKRIKASQDYIRHQYSIDRIGSLWLRALRQ